MHLSPDARLGHYQILAALGAGGMGEVYRARDTRLNRDVAIKILPAHLAADELARARFEREALAIASLSHPNILAIHDFGRHDTVSYAVTELLVGETLRDRLQRDALPLRKILQIGADIARGLAAAHDNGVVHRDVKPENVFLTSDGQVKILDFGLAKALTPEAAGAAADARTVLKRTDAGTVMGTVGYMAPEQVRGEEADHRSDIFSLGCVLYEMATGARPFERDTSAETMTAILREDPRADLPGTRPMPGALDQLVRQCLEKRREERFQSARDLSFSLGALSGTTHTSGPAAAAVPAARWRRFAAAAAALALAAAAGALAYAYFAGASPSPSASQITAFAQVTDLPGLETTPTLAPDGKAVVYGRIAGSDSALFLQRVGTRNPVRLSGAAPASDSEPVFSPDGERIAFRSERDGGGIFVMSVSGESVTRLTDFGFSPTWSPDGRHIALATTGFFTPTDVQEFPRAMSVVNVQSGERRDIARGVQPAWSPHGHRIAYYGLHKGGQRDIWTVAADAAADSAPVAVTDDAAVDWSPTWAPDGSALYFSSTRGGTMNLWRVAIDEKSGRVLGEPQPVTTPSTWSGLLSFSRDGTRLVFATLDYRSTLLRAALDPARETLTGPPVPMLKGTRPIRDHQVSPDGEWIVFAEAGVQEDLFVARTDGSQYRRLTDDSFRDRGPHWSPDGSRIMFYSDRGGGYDMWTVRADGSGLSAVTKGLGTPGFPVFSPDGRQIAYGYAGDWYLVDTPATGAPITSRPSAISNHGRFAPVSWSADGQRILGMAGSPFARLAVYDVGTRQLTPVPGDLARGYWLFASWLTDGRRAAVRRPDGIAIVDTTTGSGRLIVPIGGYMIGCSLGISRDNRWITYTETATEGDIWIATMGGRAQPAR